MAGWRMGGASRARCAWLALPLAWTSLVAGGVDVPAQVSRSTPTLGAHTLLAQAEGQGTDPAITQPLTTQASGSSLLVLNGGYASNVATPTDSYSNAWKQQGPRAVYDGYEGRFDVKAYVSLSARGGRRHTVSIVKQGKGDGEITVPFIEIRHADVLQDFAENYPIPGLVDRVEGKLSRTWRRLVSAEPVSSFSLTSGDVTTTGPATLIAVWWGDAVVYDMSAEPDSSFKVIDRFLNLPPESGVQCAVAYRQVDHADTYHVTWIGSPRQRAILWLFAFQSSAHSVNPAESTR